MSGRFAAPELLNLGRPPALAASPYETLLDASRQRLVAGMEAAGIAYDVSNLETDPAMVVTQESVYRDVLRRKSIDDALAQTYLGSATGPFLDQRAADYGVLRRVVQFAVPELGQALVMEDDDSLRLRARLAWEAQSVAGPAGAYIFHALDAHPGAFDARAYGPETGLVAPGEVLLVVQGRPAAAAAENPIADYEIVSCDQQQIVLRYVGATTAPPDGVMDAVAARLDAHYVVYGDGTQATRTVRDEQSVRPLCARVTALAAEARSYDVTATLYVRAAGDREATRAAALSNLLNYAASRRRIGFAVPRTGLESALALVSETGIPAVEDVDVEQADFVANHAEVPVPNTITLRVAVR